MFSTFIVAMSAPLSGCSPQGYELSKTGIYYDTVVTVELYGTNRSSLESIADECMKLCDHYQKLFDPDIKTSDIARINREGTIPVNVDHDTAVMISDTLRYSDLSNGKFDITIAPVSSLWNWHEDSCRIPSDDELAKACNLVDYRNVVVDTASDTVTLLSPGISIDPGASAKGFIADRISDYLDSQDITGAIVNMGGDMRLLGCKSDNSLYNIGINDPDKDGCMMTLYLSDCSVATSGTYERSFTKDGKLYHHILDPSTGKSAETDIKSVTVISAESFDCDCLCTVSILLGSNAAMDLIENTPDTEAVMLLNDNTIVRSSGSAAFIRQ